MNEPKCCFDCQYLGEEGCDGICLRLFRRIIDDTSGVPTWCPENTRRRKAALKAVEEKGGEG